MNFKELLRAANELGDFPMVEIQQPVRHSKVTIGKVTEINVRGLSVRFNDLSYDSWFWWADQNDKRSKYASELSLCAVEKIKVSSNESIQQGANSGQLQQHVVMESVCPNCGDKHTETDCGGYCTAACLQGY